MYTVNEDAAKDIIVLTLENFKVPKWFVPGIEPATSHWNPSAR